MIGNAQRPHRIGTVPRAKGATASSIFKIIYKDKKATILKR